MSLSKYYENEYSTLNKMYSSFGGKKKEVKDLDQLLKENKEDFTDKGQYAQDDKAISYLLSLHTKKI